MAFTAAARLALPYEISNKQSTQCGAVRKLRIIFRINRALAQAVSVSDARRSAELFISLHIAAV